MTGKYSVGARTLRRGRMASQNVLRAISPRHNPTQDTLNRLLKPLRLSLARLDGPQGRHAA